MHFTLSCTRYLIFIVFAGLLAVSVWWPMATLAQTGEGVRIQPALIEPDENFEPGSTHQFETRIINISGIEKTFYLDVRDIAGVNNGGTPIFADDGLTPTGFELSSWITLDQTTVTIPVGGEVTVPFTVTIPVGAAPGSHFGSIMVSSEPPEIEASGAAVGYQVANIISLRIAGDIVERASIRQFSTDQFFYASKDVEFSAHIENTGNVLVRPVGPLSIDNMFGQTVGTVIFNESQAGVLPGTVREDMRVEWNSPGTGFGRYEAVLSLSYGETGAKQSMSSTVTFWILPMNIILPALGILALLLLITYVLVRLYIRRTLAYMVPAQGRQIIRRRKSHSSAWLLVVVVMLVVTALFLIVLLALFA